MGEVPRARMKFADLSLKFVKFYKWWGHSKMTIAALGLVDDEVHERDYQ